MRYNLLHPTVATSPRICDKKHTSIKSKCCVMLIGSSIGGEWMILTLTFHPTLDKILQVSHPAASNGLQGRVVRIYAGGKGNNVARVLSRLQIPVTAAGFQGGYTGRWAKALIKAEGIPGLFIPCRAETGWSILVVENGSGRTYSIQEDHPSIQKEEEELLRAKIFPRFAKVRAVAFCGPTGSPSLAETLAQGVRQAREQGVWTVLDTSGLGMKRGVEARPDLVKTTPQELGHWLDRPTQDLTEVIQGIRALHDRGIPWVAVSLAREGLLLSDGRRVWHGGLRLARVLTSWGSEDSLLAGILYAWYQDKEPEDWVRWGLACSTANMMVLGAGFIDRHQVQALVPKVEIKTFFL